jgi:hypothetical protein
MLIGSIAPEHMDLVDITLYKIQRYCFETQAKRHAQLGRHVPRSQHRPRYFKGKRREM